MTGILSPNKPFGYLAFFPDGDVRKHQTVSAKQFCVRASTAAYTAWWGFTSLNPNKEVREGLQQRRIGGDRCDYKWFATENDAARFAKNCLRRTLLAEFGPKFFNGFGWGQNQHLQHEPFYAEVVIAPSTQVWGEPQSIAEVKALSDPRLIVGDGKYRSELIGKKTFAEGN